MLTLHGVIYCVKWGVQGGWAKIWQELWGWSNFSGVPVAPGTVSLLGGLLLAGTAHPYVRRSAYRLFYVGHVTESARACSYSSVIRYSSSTILGIQFSVPVYLKVLKVLFTLQ